MVKCPFCGYENSFIMLKTWKYRWYDVKRLQCPKCNKIFNHYSGKTPTGKTVEFTIPKPTR